MALHRTEGLHSAVPSGSVEPLHLPDAEVVLGAAAVGAAAHPIVVVAVHLEHQRKPPKPWVMG